MRRLLMLGSDAADDTHLDAAVAGLATLGCVERLTAVLVSLSADGDGSRYRNLLVRLDSALERDALREACKSIEYAQGRRPNAAAMPLDIDLLASDHAGRWHPDAHAIAKGDIDRDHVRTLLLQARIDLSSAAPRAV